MNLSIVTQVRQNHALEHATIHLLSNKQPDLRLVGRSDLKGFWLYGDVDTCAVADAVIEALERLNRNEYWLATHPRCGTNLATTALVTGGAAYAAAMLPTRSWFTRLVRVALAVAVALLTVRPLGLTVQRHVTTTADMSGMRVRSVLRRMAGKVVVHRVLLTRHEQAEEYVLHSAR
ncbi:MAG: hypothetical protein GX552_01825 [Chloroflexi bacterium]|nr:hypothetical protein [Chloroflexota bacterium]